MFSPIGLINLIGNIAMFDKSATTDAGVKNNSIYIFKVQFIKNVGFFFKCSDGCGRRGVKFFFRYNERYERNGAEFTGS